MVAHLVTTPVKGRRCGKCRRLVLAGVAEGLRVEADLAPLGEWEMVSAMLRGLDLYWLTSEGLTHIDQSRARAAGRFPVVPEHHCGVAWPRPNLPAQVTSPETDPPY